MDGPTWTVVGLLVALTLIVLALLTRRLLRTWSDDENLDITFRAILDVAPEGTANITIVERQIEAACKFFRAKRLQSKRSAEAVVLGTAVANGFIGVIGVVVTFEHWSKLGVISTALAAIAAGLAAWESHNRNHDLWIERTIIMSRFERLRRTVYFRLANGEDPDDVAADAMDKIEQLLDEDMTEWATMRNTKPAEDKSTDSPSDSSPAGVTR